MKRKRKENILIVVALYTVGALLSFGPILFLYVKDEIQAKQSAKSENEVVYEEKETSKDETEDETKIATEDERDCYKEAYEEGFFYGYESGYERGYSEGYSDGYTEGYNAW